jgi:hypothetical protein
VKRRTPRPALVAALATPVAKAVEYRMVLPAQRAAGFVFRRKGVLEGFIPGKNAAVSPAAFTRKRLDFCIGEAMWPVPPLSSMKCNSNSALPLPATKPLFSTIPRSPA